MQIIRLATSLLKKYILMCYSYIDSVGIIDFYLKLLPGHVRYFGICRDSDYQRWFPTIRLKLNVASDVGIAEPT